MIAATAGVARRTLGFAVALGVALCASAVALAADAPIYKCPDADGAVLYTDQPCPAGEMLDIRPGRADPDATVRLEAARAELAHGAARLREREAMVAARREELELLRSAAPPLPGFAPEPFDAPVATYGIVGGYPPPFRRHPRAAPIRPHDAKPPLRASGRVPAHIQRPRHPR
jgi:hypothetical protein